MERKDPITRLHEIIWMRKVRIEEDGNAASCIDEEKKPVVLNIKVISGNILSCSCLFVFLKKFNPGVE